MKCNKLNHTDYTYFQGSNDPWYCFIKNVVPKFILLEHYQKDYILSTTNILFQGINSENDRDSSLSLKPSNLALLPNQFSNTFQVNSYNDPKNVVNSKYYDTDQIEISG